MIILAGDVGGTKTRLALFETEYGTPKIIDETHLRSADVPSLGDAIRQYLERHHVRVDAAGIGIAAPIHAGRSYGPNLPWVVTADEVAAAVGTRAAVIANDFTVLGAGIPYLTAQEQVTIQEGTRVRQGTIALIGAGTGLGAGFLTWNGSGYTVHPSEGGHVTFAPRNGREWGLSTYLHTRFGSASYGHISYERILSGSGLYAVYRYLVDTRQAIESDLVTTEMHYEDPAAVITRHAEQETDQACVDAVDLFIDVYGAQAGNLALTVLATGGVYVAGGIVKHIISRMRTGRFSRAFNDKGRISTVTQEIPVYAVISESVALLGAALIARDKAGQSHDVYHR